MRASRTCSLQAAARFRSTRPRPFSYISLRSDSRRWLSTAKEDDNVYDDSPSLPKLPFRFETGVAVFAKRATRPFPPPFLSLPSTSFSEPLSTFHRSRDRRPKVNGELIRGRTNGDDAIFASAYFICANDGVGAWSSRPRGHAGFVALLAIPVRLLVSLLTKRGFFAAGCGHA
jgi:protein phosphatase PTC7